MKEEMIRKYVKDMDGLLEEISKAQYAADLSWLKVSHDEVIFLFGRIFRFLDFKDIYIAHQETGDFDAMALRGDDLINVEFEVYSQSFESHHSLKSCDLIVCWKDDWGEECPVDVFELKYFWEKAQEK